MHRTCHRWHQGTGEATWMPKPGMGIPGRGGVVRQPRGRALHCGGRPGLDHSMGGRATKGEKKRESIRARHHPPPLP